MFITHTGELVHTVHQTIELWLTRIFPILFPFYILGTLFIHYGISHFIGELLSPITRFLFKTKAISGFVLLMAMISGNPQSAMMIAELYQQGGVNKREAEHLLKFSVFANPLFIIGTIGVGYFYSLKIGVIILISHVLSNIVIGFYLRFSQPPLPYAEGIRPYHQLVKHQTKKPFGEILTITLQKGLNIMFLVCGFMIFFNIFVLLLTESNTLTVFYQFVTVGGKIPIPYDAYYSIMIGIFEIVRFLDVITKTDLTVHSQVTLIATMLSFGGLSIHAQIQSVLERVKVPYRPFLFYRIVQMMLSGLFAYFLFPYLYQEEKTIEVVKLFEQFHHLQILSIICFLIILLIIYIITQKRKTIKT